MKDYMQNILHDNEEYLDRVALKVLGVLLMRERPATRADESRLARLAHNQALAMLKAKMSIEDLASESKLFPETEPKNDP